MTKERNEYRNGSKKYKEYDAQIILENEWYQKEYEAVQKFLQRLASYPEEVRQTNAEADF